MQFSSGVLNDSQNGNVGTQIPNDNIPEIQNPPDGDGSRDFNRDVGLFAMIFEDRLADDIDWDHNDMAVKFSVKEFYNSSNQLQKIEMIVYPRPFEGTFSNGLRLSPDGLINNIGSGSDRNLLVKQTKPLFNGPGSIVVTKIKDTNPNKDCYAGKTFDKADDVIIFTNQQVAAYPISSNTRDNRCVYQVTVNIGEPSQNPISSRPKFDISQYRFFLHASNENRMVDLIDVNNKFYGFGRPLGLFVPVEFGYPPPAQPIGNFYSNYGAYINWLKAGRPVGADPKIVEWYKYPNGRKGQLIDGL